jgi:hypothetical protein
MGWWVIPAMIGSAAVTVMGIQQQKKAMKANAAWGKYERELDFHYDKQKRLTQQKKLLSEQRARGGGSGSVVGTGSSLVTFAADMEEFENDMWFVEKGLFTRNSAADADLQGQITAANYQIGSTLLNTAASTGMHKANMDNAAKYGTKGSSDIRLKMNIKAIGRLANGLNIYTWDWNVIGQAVKSPWQPNKGVMAQEVQQVIPDAVIRDKHGYLMVDYSHPDLQGAIR